MFKADVHLSDMLHYVHRDEKFFYLTKTTRKYYILGTANHNEHGYYINETSMWWDGKIGSWSFVESKVLLSIAAKWPNPDKTVRLQHRNARAHVTSMDAQLTTAFDEYGKKGRVFSLVPQPPNSPDTNILDLGFFAAIQPLQHKKSASLPFGDYAYMVPHMGKVNMARNGQLPQNVQCPPDVYHTCLEKLAAQDAVAMERAVSAEVEEARCLDTLARELECIHLSDCEATDDIISTMPK
ncbi:hypothetical protein H310_15152 [Aphanomyces invadans]|uniref:Uncharacterized protein n=1 Tax=Aphanomyces invadans TaxID=157072 RepID=A0A024T9K7_9STRA|nr:hypothetical protein H310_15152 [Aphanomyces invadans]ETV90007.1 hypothetical protein H310_15152 [Aphanomyces invadans]|eukprot:XP_008881361.1 hypothetical protein H310_15152 [Aphanomyces invadans]